MPEELLYCYNKGCGKQYTLKENDADSCCFHPGTPVFHDAYKGWSCCKKKCTDFTEFLNIKGCTTSYHSNEKPPEPDKPAVDKDSLPEVVEVRAPIEAAPARLPRPPFETPLVTVKPTIASSLVAQTEKLALKNTSGESHTSAEIALGSSCKHNSCKETYSGPGASLPPCQHHPGVPVFHEGLKYWSCCTKRTTEFSDFLEQAGCTVGDHKWTEDEGAVTKPVCRHDWHQTGGYVIISIYAKKYDPKASTVQLNPIRAKIDLLFPEDGATFNMDLELRGVIDVENSEVNMLGTKVEIKLKKAELGTWTQLDFPRVSSKAEAEPVKAAPVAAQADLFDDDPVDLNDIN